jgi:hypothetical protein
MRTFAFAAALTFAACSGSSTPATIPTDPATPVATPPETTTAAAVPATRAVEPPKPATPIADAYAETAAKILAAARSDDMRNQTYARLAHLTDRIGARLAGSKALEQAIAWAAETMKADGQDVRTEKVMVPHWVRGEESGKIVAPIEHELAMIGLGGTVATPKKGLTAPVIVVTSWDDLKAKAADVKGKIVLYDVPMPAWSEDKGSGYGDVVLYRWAGASQAAKLGAVGAMVRSVTARSLRTPHTGSMGYEDGVTKVPNVAVSVEDAELIHRLYDSGETVKVTIRTSGKFLPDAESANVLGEIKGSEKPDEIVVISAHIDSWDVGQGAHDDGAGVVACMQALAVLRQLGLQPRRTIRVVLYTNEENGIRGGRGYAKDHAAELTKHVGALEMDIGGFAPRGFDVDDGLDDELGAAHGSSRRDRMVARMTDLATLLAPIQATRVKAGHAGTDVEPLAKAGVPAVGLVTDNRTYFDIHHTEADTLDKVDPAQLADNVAALAVWAFVVADLPGRLDDPE